MDTPTIPATSSVASAIDALQSDLDRGVVVLDELGHVMGILTEGDIVRAYRRGTLAEAGVESILTGRVKVSVTPLKPIELAREFAQFGTLLIPIVDKDRKLLFVQRTREAVKNILDQG